MFEKIEEPFKIISVNSFIYDRVFPKDFVFAGETHNFWEIVYVINGKIEVVENDEIYILSDGDMIFHAPMEFHRIRSIDNSTPHVLNLSFKIAGDLPNCLANGIYSLSKYQENKFLKVFNLLYMFFHDKSSINEYTTQEALCRLSLFFIELKNNGRNNNRISITDSAVKYKMLVELMNNAVDLNYKIDDFAKQAYISKSYLKLLFSTYAGISPKTYYNNLRIIRASTLLENGYSINNISEIMSFSSYTNFTRFFKTITGKVPSQYKK